MKQPTDFMWQHKERFKIERVYANPESSPGDILDYLTDRLNDIPFNYQPIGPPFLFDGLLCQLLYWPEPEREGIS